MSLVWDAALDPLIGIIADKTETRFGKYGPFILLGAPVCSFSFAAIFAFSALNDGDLSLVLLIFYLMVFRTSYTLIDLPHNALLARILSDSRQRGVAAGLRFFFSSLAALIIGLSSIAILKPIDIAAHRDNFMIFGFFAASLSWMVMWLSWFSVGDRDRLARRSEKIINTPYISALKILGGYTNTRILFFIFFAIAFFIPVYAKSISYFAKYNLDDASLIGVAVSALMVGQGISVFAWSWLSSHFEKVKALQIALLLLCAILLIYGFSSGVNTLSFILVSGLVGCALGGIYSIGWGMAPDVIDAVEVDTGVRPEGAFIGLLIVVMKIATALGVGLLGVAYEAFGYSANEVQSEATLNGIRTTMWLWPALGAALILIASRSYRLSHYDHSRILSKLSGS